VHIEAPTGKKGHPVRERGVLVAVASVEDGLPEVETVEVVDGG